MTESIGTGGPAVTWKDPNYDEYFAALRSAKIIVTYVLSVLHVHCLLCYVVCVRSKSFACASPFRAMCFLWVMTVLYAVCEYISIKYSLLIHTATACFAGAIRQSGKGTSDCGSRC